MKKKNLIGLVLVLFLVVGLSIYQENNVYAQNTCTECQLDRREHIRGCISLWGSFSDGEAGGFLATGWKKVCRRDKLNSCLDSWLTGCESAISSVQ